MAYTATNKNIPLYASSPVLANICLHHIRCRRELELIGSQKEKKMQKNKSEIFLLTRTHYASYSANNVLKMQPLLTNVRKHFQHIFDI